MADRATERSQHHIVALLEHLLRWALAGPVSTVRVDLDLDVDGERR